MPEPCDILDISPGADIEEIQAAYRQKCRELHPDVGGNRADFMQVVRARDELLSQCQQQRDAGNEIDTGAGNEMQLPSQESSDAIVPSDSNRATQQWEEPKTPESEPETSQTTEIASTESLQNDSDTGRGTSQPSAKESSTDPDSDEELVQEIFWDDSAEPIPTPADAVGKGSLKKGDDESDLLDRKIDEWRSQLIDLTRKNNLIHCRNPPKTKALPIEGPNPTAIAHSLLERDTLPIRKYTKSGSNEPHTGSFATDELVSQRKPQAAQETLDNIRLNNKKHLRERGVDTLYLALGHLRWFDLEEIDREYISPLFLVAVDLQEESTTDSNHHNFTVTLKSDGIILNPALRKKLLADWHVALPTDAQLSLESIDAAFETVYQAVKGFRRWRIEDDVVFGVFDFTKISLYEDLDANRSLIKEDPIIRGLVGQTDALMEREGDIDPPSAQELDEVVDPVNTYQVLDADSSQQAAIEAAKAGQSFVLQGPPGTGKSQTIANIIAEKLAQNETILFVSEKQAALEVVKNRLDAAGIGRFCLEAHGTKARQTEVLSTLESELQAPEVKATEDRIERLAELAEIRKQLNDYGRDIFYSPDEWDLTVYDAFGIVSNADCDRIETGISEPVRMGQDQIEEAIAALEKLNEYEAELASYHTHPWRHTTLTEVAVDTRENMRQSLQEQCQILRDIQSHSTELKEQYNFEITSIEGYREAGTLLGLMANRPEVEWTKAHFDPSLVADASQLQELSELEKQREQLRTELGEKYRPSYFELEPGEIHEQLAALGSLRYLKPSWYSLKSRLLEHTTAEYSPDYNDLRSDIRKLLELKQLDARIAEFSQLIDRCGSLYPGKQTEWDPLLAAISWLDEFYTTADKHTDAVEDLLLEEITIPPCDVAHQQITELLSEYETAAKFFEESMAIQEMDFDGEPLRSAAIDDVLQRFERLETQVDELPRRIRFENQLSAVKETEAEVYVEQFLAGEYEPLDLVPGFAKSFYTQWLNEVYSTTGLGTFSADELYRQVTKFRQLDVEQQELAAQAIQQQITAQRPDIEMQHAESSEQAIVRREVSKQQNHIPLRELFDTAGDFITDLTPCFMMSPLSVAEYLKEDAIEFDCVIFDEASQITPEDAISSLIRAEQAIVAGDSKQLPPTTFFEADTDTTENVREDLESILKELAAFLPEKHLKWHYRSRSEELIDFSNATYYNNRLRTFPANEPETETGVFFCYVEDGVYDRGGTRTNAVEAQRVVDLIEKHAEEKPEKSLGVVAFSKAQEQAIRDVLDEQCTQNTVLESFVEKEDVLDEFFVKNLDRVQGDERDRMIFSVGYGFDGDGEISMNFGPLNRSGGQRRLNVAITRAREMVTIVSSIQPTDIDLSGTSSRGVAHFKAYLEYAKQNDSKESEKEPVSPSSFHSDFKRVVYSTLLNEDLQVEPIGDNANYSLDFGVKASPEADEYLLGIELDGSVYRHGNTARDRDRTRPLMLERLGWELHRIWSPDWIANLDREVERILDKVEHNGTEGATAETEDIKPKTSSEPELIETSGEPLDHPSIGTYVKPELPAGGTRSWDEVPLDSICADIADVVAEWGPLKEEVVYRTVIEGWGESMLHQSKRELMVVCRNQLAQDGVLIHQDGFLWPAKEQLDFAVRVPDGSATRSIEEIPKEELGMAMVILLTEGGSMEEDDLRKETARLFGYQRRGAKIQERLDFVLEYAFDNDILQEANERVRVTESEDPEHQLISHVIQDVYKGNV